MGLATGAYGVSCGALGVAAGLSITQTVLTSLLIFSGGSQFAFFGVIGAGGSPAAAVATSGLLGVRNGIYGLQVVQLLDVRGWRRLLAAHWMIDESTAVAGEAMGDPRSYGLDAAAAFAALLWPRLTGRDPLATAAVAVLLTVLVAPLAPPGVPVLVAAVAALAVGFLAMRRGPVVAP